MLVVPGFPVFSVHSPATRPVFPVTSILAFLIPCVIVTFQAVLKSRPDALHCITFNRRRFPSTVFKARQYQLFDLLSGKQDKCWFRVEREEDSWLFFPLVPHSATFSFLPFAVVVATIRRLSGLSSYSQADLDGSNTFGIRRQGIPASISAAAVDGRVVTASLVNGLNLPLFHPWNAVE